MQTSILVSVFITSYNMEKYIARALDSVLMQKVSFPYEIVITDDCSTDNTVSIIEEYQKKYGTEKIRVIKNSTNRGLITNFFEGIFHTKGALLAPLDADDYWIDSYKLQKQFDILEQNPSIGFVYSNYFNEDETTFKRRAEHPTDFQYPTDFYTANIWDTAVQISTPMIRKMLITQEVAKLFIKQNFHAQDLPLFLWLSDKTKGYYMPHITSVYTVRKGSLSRSTNYKKRIHTLQEGERIRQFFLAQKPIDAKLNAKREFKLKLNIFLASWHSNDISYIQQYAKALSIKDFLQHNPKALYLFFAAKNKFLLRVIKPWIFRKRKIGL